MTYFSPTPPPSHGNGKTIESKEFPDLSSAVVQKKSQVKYSLGDKTFASANLILEGRETECSMATECG
jgi:hypothetical protein